MKKAIVLGISGLVLVGGMNSAFAGSNGKQITEQDLAAKGITMEEYQQMVDEKQEKLEKTLEEKGITMEEYKQMIGDKKSKEKKELTQEDLEKALEAKGITMEVYEQMKDEKTK